MRFIVMLLVACGIPLVAIGQSLPAEAPPPSMKDTPLTRQQWDDAMGRCSNSVVAMMPDVPRYRRNNYCRCFVLRSTRAFPRGIPKKPSADVENVMRPIVESCYGRFILPWHKKQRAPQ